jgi:hypothetical protein
MRNICSASDCRSEHIGLVILEHVLRYRGDLGYERWRNFGILYSSFLLLLYTWTAYPLQFGITPLYHLAMNLLNTWYE